MDYGYDMPNVPLIGEQAPEFKAPSTRWEINFPEDYEWKWVVLFSHPADFTPVCTTEFMAFQAKKEEFEKLNCDLIGYSVDWVHSHIAWVKNIKEKFGVEITFPIVAHPSIAYNYGMLQPTADDSHTVRAVFIIDPEGKIAALMYYPLSNGRNIDEILRLVKSLQTTADYGRATESMEQAKENTEKFDCKDWYICTDENPNK